MHRSPCGLNVLRPRGVLGKEHDGGIANLPYLKRPHPVTAKLLGHLEMRCHRRQCSFPHLAPERLRPTAGIRVGAWLAISISGRYRLFFRMRRRQKSWYPTKKGADHVIVEGKHLDDFRGSTSKSHERSDDRRPHSDSEGLPLFPRSSAEEASRRRIADSSP